MNQSVLPHLGPQRTNLFSVLGGPSWVASSRPATTRRLEAKEGMSVVVASRRESAMDINAMEKQS